MESQTITLDLDTPADKAPPVLIGLGFVIPAVTLAFLASNPHLFKTRGLSHAVALASLVLGAVTVAAGIRLLQTVDCYYVVDRKRNLLVYRQSVFGFDREVPVAALSEIRGVHVRGCRRPVPGFPAPVVTQLWLSIDLASGRRVRVSNRTIASRFARSPADTVEAVTTRLSAKARRVAEVLGLEEPTAFIEDRVLAYRGLYVVQLIVALAGLRGVMQSFDVMSPWAPLGLVAGLVAFVFLALTIFMV
jgi:hypothetical protein